MQKAPAGATEDASAIERILIARVAITWLNLHLAEMKSEPVGSVSLILSKHQQYLIDRGQRRHSAAFKSLATVRQMALPLLIKIKAQIAISEKMEAK